MANSRRLRACLGAVLLLSVTRQLSAQELRVAAASDLQNVLPMIAARFERETGQRVAATFGSSGNFFTQIQNGAPFDVFLSADIEYPRRLDQQQRAEPGSLFEYAEGTIVLWARSDSGVDVRAGMSVLDGPRAAKIAIANPEHAPYGRAAVAAVQHAGLYDRVKGKFVLGENISQAAQFVQSGNAAVGIIALSLALAPAMRDVGVYWQIPSDWYPTIEQGGVILANSARKPTARQFIAFLKRPDTVRLMQDFGFSPPPRIGR